MQVVLSTVWERDKTCQKGLNIGLMILPSAVVGGCEGPAYRRVVLCRGCLMKAGRSFDDALMVGGTIRRRWNDISSRKSVVSHRFWCSMCGGSFCRVERSRTRRGQSSGGTVRAKFEGRTESFSVS